MNVSFYYGRLNIETEGKNGMLYDYRIDKCITTKSEHRGWNEKIFLKVIDGTINTRLFPVFGSSNSSINMKDKEIIFPAHYLTDTDLKWYMFKDIPPFYSWDTWKYDFYFDDKGNISKVVDMRTDDDWIKLFKEGFNDNLKREVHNKYTLGSKERGVYYMGINHCEKVSEDVLTDEEIKVLINEKYE